MVDMKVYFEEFATHERDKCLLNNLIADIPNLHTYIETLVTHRHTEL